jgi:acid stress-induced BolA-like protein IbaG/YrbA
MTEQELADALRSVPLPEPPEVTVTRDRFRYIAIVIAPAFEGMNEAERQRIVWRQIFEKFQLSELREIEMVLTDSPSEVARYEAGLPVEQP